MDLYSSIQSQVGITDEVTTCSCCGRSNLKKTVVFKMSCEWIGEDFSFLGSHCASKVKLFSSKRWKDRVNSKGQTETEAAIEVEQKSTVAEYKVWLLSRGLTMQRAEEIVEIILTSNPNPHWTMRKKLNEAKQEAVAA